MINVHDIQIEELAAFLMDTDLEELTDKDGEYGWRLWTMFFHKFGIEGEDFAKLISALVPLIEVGKSPLTDKIYKGFVDGEKKLWLVKIEVAEDA